MHEHYVDKGTDAKGYFDNVKIPLLDLIPQNLRAGRILEIGAAGGNTLIYAKQNNYAREVYGVELCELKNSNQKDKMFSDFIIGNIEEIELPYEDNYFDIILCADVLEHLVDPYRVVKKLRKYLKSDGVFIASIPNIRNLAVFRDVYLLGDFKYTEHGILDKTHLRFFTKKNMISLFKDNGYTVYKVIPSDKCNLVRYLKQIRIFKLLRCVFSVLFKEFFTIQYYLVSKKNNN